MQLKGIIRLISQISRVSQVSQKYVFADVTTSAISLDVPLATVTADGVESLDTIRKPALYILTTKKKKKQKH